MTIAHDSSAAAVDLDKIWSIAIELSSQLSQNRLQTEELQRRAEELKTQAIHTQTGFTLRRFNIDISQEEFDSELERLNVSLVLENQGLQQENRQLSILLKDYEGTLEAVMGKFRAHAQSTQQHHLDLIRHYESILLSLPANSNSTEEIPSIDPLHLSLSLSHLATLIRKALRSLQGEDPEDLAISPNLFPTSATSDFSSLSSELSSLSFSSHSRSSSIASSSLNGSNCPSPTRSNHSRNESEGGYVGKSATSNPHYLPTTSASSLVPDPTLPVVPKEKVERKKDDEALEGEIELERLRRENEELRRLLGISEIAL